MIADPRRCIRVASILVFAMAVPLSGAGCAASSGTSPAQAGPGSIASLDFSPSLVVIRKGDTKPLKVTATMGDGTKKDVTGEVEWASENPDRVTVDTHGTIVGAGIGVTTIKVVYKDATGTVPVTVAP